jgi:hypothetical protein
MKESVQMQTIVLECIHGYKVVMVDVHNNVIQLQFTECGTRR